jgi:hypothetical protein
MNRAVNYFLFCLFLSIAFRQMCAAQGTNDATRPAVAPAVPPQGASGSNIGLPIGAFLSLARGLEINPKIISATDGNGTTVGLDYKYDRELMRSAVHRDTDLLFSFKSSGLILAEASKVPNNMFTHTLRLSLIDLLPRNDSDDSAAAKHNKELNNHIAKVYFDPWTRLAEKHSRTPEEDAQMAGLFDGAARELRQYGPLHADLEANQWYLPRAGGGNIVYDRASRHFHERSLFLSADFDANIEHDQSLTNVQFVGSAQIRGKVLSPIFDWPFEQLRKTEDNPSGKPRNWLNRAGGPYFWAGIGVVDASQNDARRAITSEHKTFPRFHAGLSYRTELFAVSEANSVALELTWLYYYEIGAPAPLRAQHLDSTSYFKGTVLLPGNFFVEYTNGRLPLDVVGGTTVGAGWRYNF